MQVTETLAEGLKREFRIVIGAADLGRRLDSRLATMKDQVQIRGFRRGHVPVTYLKKTFGKNLMGEIVQEAVAETTQTAMSERALRPAMQPSIELESPIEGVVEKGQDLAFKVAVELLPDVALTDFAGIALERLAADVEEGEVEAALTRLADQQKNYEPRAEGSAAETGDALTIDFLGSIDGVPFDGGKGEDVRIVIGAGQFIPGFEEGLIGASAGEARTVTVTFPETYAVEKLKGKEASFAVTVHEVRAPQAVALDDAFAARFGMETLDKLKDALRSQAEGEYARAGRLKVKRALLDALDSRHSFELPPGLVAAEFEQIWAQVKHGIEHGHPAPEDAGKSEDELKADYRKIAERRVRLGLVLAEVGRSANLAVTQEEMTRAIAFEARRYPGQERQIFEYFGKNPQAQAQIRAPIFEDKVVDHLLTLVSLSERKVSKDELFKDLGEEEPMTAADHDHDHEDGHGHAHGEPGHVHGPDCDHDH